MKKWVVIIVLLISLSACAPAESVEETTTDAPPHEDVQTTRAITYDTVELTSAEKQKLGGDLIGKLLPAENRRDPLKEYISENGLQEQVNGAYIGNSSVVGYSDKMISFHNMKEILYCFTNTQDPKKTKLTIQAGIHDYEELVIEITREKVESPEEASNVIAAHFSRELLVNFYKVRIFVDGKETSVSQMSNNYWE